MQVRPREQLVSRPVEESWQVRVGAVFEPRCVGRGRYRGRWELGHQDPAH